MYYSPMDDELGYGNFPWVITENQSQIPPWESLVKVKNKLKKHESSFGEYIMHTVSTELTWLLRGGAQFGNCKYKPLT